MENADLNQLKYYVGFYEYGDGYCINAEHPYYGPWATLTVNLYEYGKQPEEGHVFVPVYNLERDTIKAFLSKFAESFSSFYIGPYDSHCLDVKLKKDWAKELSNANLFWGLRA